MSNDPAVRRILPQNTQMNAFTFAPQTYQQPRETQKSASHMPLFSPAITLVVG